MSFVFDKYLTSSALYMQAKLIANENGFVFNPKKFNFSTRWLFKFKQAFNIRRVRLHGEGADADMRGVAITRAQLPPLLCDIDPENIYNFDETGESSFVADVLHVMIDR